MLARGLVGVALLALVGCITESTPRQDECEGCDASRTDAGRDLGSDLGEVLPDRGARDRGPPDRGPQDQGPQDQGPPDQGGFDAIVIDADRPNACPRPDIGRLQGGTSDPPGAYVLSGATSSDRDGEVVAWRWRVVEAPRGVEVQLLESFADATRPQAGGPADDVTTPRVQVWLGTVGHYVFELSVTDDDGAAVPSAACPGGAAQAALDVSLDGDLVVVVTWYGANDANRTDHDGPDLDGHLLHPSALAWGRPPLDCHTNNRAPEWGAPGPAGDCLISTDSSAGIVPESLSVQTPEDTDALGAPYRLGVYYYRAESFEGGTYGVAMAQVRVYLGGLLAYEVAQELETTGYFWDVAAIHWNGQGGRVTPIDRVYPTFADGVAPIP